MDKRNGEITNKIFEILNNIKGFDVAMANPNNGIIIAKYNNINYYISVDPIFNDNEEGDKANAEPFERIVKTHSHVFRWWQFYVEDVPDIYVGKMESEEWIMDNFDKETIALKYGARMYDYIQHKIKDNKRLISTMKPLNKDTTHIEIDIESAEYALGLRDDRPKLHEFVENRKAN